MSLTEDADRLAIFAESVMDEVDALPTTLASMSAAENPTEFRVFMADGGKSILVQFSEVPE